MDRVQDEELRSRVRSVDPTTFDRFVATLLAAVGWQTTLAEDDNDLGVDLIGVTDDAEGRYLVRVRPSPDDVVDADEVRRYARIAAKSDPVEGVLIVTPGRVGETARSAAEDGPVECLDAGDVAGMVGEAEARGVLDRFADPDAAGSPEGSGGDGATGDDGATAGEGITDDASDGGVRGDVADDGIADDASDRGAADEVGDGDGDGDGDGVGDLEAAAPSTPGGGSAPGGGFDRDLAELPDAFAEVRRDAGPGSVAEMDDDERTRLVQGLVAHAPDDGITERLLLETVERGGLFDRPLADYLHETEQPAHVLKESTRPVRTDDEGADLEPDGDGSTYHLVTNARVLMVVGRPDGDRALSLPLGKTEVVDFEPALFDAEVVLSVEGATYRLPIHHGGDGAVETAIRYVRRGPHPWEDATLSFGTIDDPASFDSL